MRDVRLTANARAMGSRQNDALRLHGHRVRGTNTATPFSSLYAVGGAANTLAGGQAGGDNFYEKGPAGGSFPYIEQTGGAETRGPNVAYYPRIHA